MGLGAGSGEVGWEGGGGWAGALGLQGDHCTGLMVRSQEGLPGPSGGWGNSNNQVWVGGMSWMHEAGRGVGRRAAQKKPPTPSWPLQTPLWTSHRQSDEIERAETGQGQGGDRSFQSLPSAILPHVGHQPRGGGGSRGKGFISEASNRSTNIQMVLPDPGAK